MFKPQGCNVELLVVCGRYISEHLHVLLKWLDVDPEQVTLKTPKSTTSVTRHYADVWQRGPINRRCGQFEDSASIDGAQPAKCGTQSEVSAA